MKRPLSPNLWDAYVFLARVHYAQGKIKAAKQDLEKAVALAPANGRRPEDLAPVLAKVEAELTWMSNMRETATAHLIVRFPTALPQPLVETLCSGAEKVYEEIGRRFNYYPTTKPVILLPTERKYLMELAGISLAVPAMNQSSANRIFLTFIFGQDDTSDMLQWLRKEYVAFIVRRLSYEADPHWLNEALSLAIAHEQATRAPEIVAYTRRWLQDRKKLPSIEEVNALFEGVVSKRKPPPRDEVYPQMVNGAAMAIGKYLIEKVGFSRLRQALQEIGNGGDVKQALSSALGMSWEEFEAAWKKRAQERYGSPKLTAEQHYAFARAYATLNDFKSAMKEIQQAIALEPTVGKYHALLAAAYWVTGQKERALAACGEALQHHINDPVGYQQIVSIYINARQFDKGLTVAEQAMKEGHADSRVYSGAALIYLEKNQPQAALPLAEKAVELDSGDGLSQTLLFRALVKSGLLDKAIELGEQLVALNSNLEEVHYWLGIAYRDKGDKERAKAALEKALALGHKEAKEALGTLKK